MPTCRVSFSVQDHNVNKGLHSIVLYTNTLQQFRLLYEVDYESMLSQNDTKMCFVCT